MDQMQTNTDRATWITGTGVLEITEKGYGFLRQAKNDYRATPGDPFVGKDFVRHGGLRTGLHIEGLVARPPRRRAGPSSRRSSRSTAAPSPSTPTSSRSTR